MPAAVLLVAVGAVLRAPSYPINDPAIFEYYGREIIRGHHLYGDITDVKLPSIYIVNALWQLLFGAHYLVHTVVEVLIDLVTIALFALLLRAYEVRSWQWGTALFAIAFSLIFPQFDYPQHYAVLLILIAYYVGLSGFYVEAAIALALAVTFWTSAVLLGIPLIAAGMTREQLRSFVLAGAGTGVAYYLAFVPAFGLDWILKPLAMWPANFANNGVMYNLLQLRVTVLGSALGPAIGALLCLLFATLRRPEDRAQRFALWWSACALAGTALPPRFTEHFFLPSVPALSMAVAAYGLPSRGALRRPLALLLAAGCAFFAIRSDIVISRSNQLYAVYIQNAGRWITDNVGRGRVIWSEEYIPELDLAADAILPDPYALVTNYQDLAQGILRERGHEIPVRIVRAIWDRWPDLLVFGPISRPDDSVQSLLLVTPDARLRATYALVCGRNLFLSHMAFYAPPELARRFTCPD